MKAPERGEIWLVDLGLAGKVRPALVLSVPVSDADRALATLVPRTTSLRGTRFEVAFDLPFLHVKSGGVDAQNLVTVSHVKLVRSLGRLKPDQLAAVEGVVRAWLGLVARNS